MPTEIRAAVLVEPNKPLQVQMLTLADPRPNEVRIRLLATGLCHSDLNYLRGDASYYLPVVLGHEGFGVVAEVGSEVRSVQVGDTVIPYLVPDCGVCDWCSSGITNKCRTMNLNRDVNNLGYSPLSREGQPVGNLLGTATFAEQTVVRETQVVKVNPAADPALACCLACGVTTGLGAALNTARVRPDSSVAVFGLGGVGLGAIQGAKIAGATTVIAIDTNPAKSQVARRLGATHFIDANTADVAAQVRDITNGGAGYAFECAGRASIYYTAMDSLSAGGGAMLIGVGVLAAGDEIRLTPAQLSGTMVTRSFMGNAKRADVARYVDWFVEGKIDLQDIVSHRLTLDEIDHGYDLVESGDAVRVVVEL